MCFLPQWKQNAVGSAHSAVRPLPPRTPWPVFLHTQSDPTRDGAPSPTPLGSEPCLQAHRGRRSQLSDSAFQSKETSVCVALPPKVVPLTRAPSERPPRSPPPRSCAGRSLGPRPELQAHAAQLAAPVWGRCHGSHPGTSEAPRGLGKKR